LGLRRRGHSDARADGTVCLRSRIATGDLFTLRGLSVPGSSRKPTLASWRRRLCAVSLSLAGCLTFSVGHALATPGSPEVKIYGAAAVTKTSAQIEVGINSEGSQATYEIWLECQSAGGDNQTCEPLTVGEQLQHGVVAAGLELHTVTATVSGLQPGYLYKYRVVAANSAGKAGWVGSGLVTCPSEGVCPGQPSLPGEELWVLEGAIRAGEEAPRLEAERVAKRKEEEERPAREAGERATREREIREAGERAGKQASERNAAVTSHPRCVVPHLDGDSLFAARRALERAHCSLGKVTGFSPHHGALVVGRQSVRSGSKLAGGAKVAVTLRRKRSARPK
jgi:hypothetical protein